jgi:hypothetical protein
MGYPQVCKEKMVMAEAHYFFISWTKVRQRFVQSQVGVLKFQLHRKLHSPTTNVRLLVLSHLQPHRDSVWQKAKQVKHMSFKLSSKFSSQEYSQIFIKRDSAS